MGGGEEQRAVDAVGDDVLVEQRLLLVGVVARRRGESRPAGPSWRSARRATNPATTRPSRTAVTRSNSTVAAAVIARTAASPRVERISAREAGDPDHVDGGGDQHAGQRRERDVGDPAGGHQHDHEQDQRMGQRRQPRGRPGADVHRGSRDRGGGRDAAEQRGAQVGQPLADELAVGVVALARRSSRRPPWPTAGSPGRPGRRRRPRAAAGRRARPSGTWGSSGAGSPVGISPIVAAPSSSAELATVAAITAIKETGQSGPDPCPDQDDARSRPRSRRGRPRGVGGPGLDGAPGQRQHLLGVDVHAEGSGQLLQRDDRRDAER